MPFVPQDMNPHEKSLLASITAQTIAQRAATTPEELAAAREEARQVAGEMIWAERAESVPPEPEEPAEGYLKRYYEGLAADAEADRAMYDDGEPYSFEIPEPKPKD
jgi:hypothetical protein